MERNGDKSVLDNSFFRENPASLIIIITSTYLLLYHGYALLPLQLKLLHPVGLLLFHQANRYPELALKAFCWWILASKNLVALVDQCR